VLRVAEEVEPRLVDDSEVLWRPGIDEDIVAAAPNQIDQDVHLFTLVPAVYPIDLWTWNPEGAGIERLYRVLHASPTFDSAPDAPLASTTCRAEPAHTVEKYADITAQADRPEALVDPVHGQFW
jgi:hypothetical protein